jgi:hypothetical protein
LFSVVPAILSFSVEFGFVFTGAAEALSDRIIKLTKNNVFFIVSFFKLIIFYLNAAG